MILPLLAASAWCASRLCLRAGIPVWAGDRGSASGPIRLAFLFTAWSSFHLRRALFPAEMQGTPPTPLDPPLGDTDGENTLLRPTRETPRISEKRDAATCRPEIPWWRRLRFRPPKTLRRRVARSVYRPRSLLGAKVQRRTNPRVPMCLPELAPEPLRGSQPEPPEELRLGKGSCLLYQRPLSGRGRK